MKTMLKYLAYAVGTLSFAYLLFMALFSSYLSGSAKETWEAMQNSPFSCPPGTEVTYRNWAENGRQRYCEKVKEGPWEAWMSGYKWVQGNYKDGKEHGEWVRFNKDGTVRETTTYENGVEIGSKK